MASDRFFSEAIQFSAVKNNLANNNGSICCELCGKNLKSISECHFDHVTSYAKGGKSTLENCQILCIECNLKKSDKELADFALEEKARQFLRGNTLDINTATDDNAPVTDNDSKSGVPSKEEFDQIVGAFIQRKGNIHKVDFTREYNHLPSIWLVRKYYGDLNELKKAFGIVDMSLNWNRENILSAIKDYVDLKGDVSQSDMTSKNNLPSVPCILGNYPEFKTWSEFKKTMLGLRVNEQWTKDKVIAAAQTYLQTHTIIRECDLKSKNNLPTPKVIYDLFGSMNTFQIEVGSDVSKSCAFISKEDLSKLVDLYFGNQPRVIESRKVFLDAFQGDITTIYKRYGTFEAFCQENGITVLKYKKGKYTKQEVDTAIKDYIANGNPIPTAKELTKLGLPSMSVIMKYYENWKEPFVLYETLYRK